MSFGATNFGLTEGKLCNDFDLKVYKPTEVLVVPLKEIIRQFKPRGHGSNFHAHFEKPMRFALFLLVLFYMKSLLNLFQRICNVKNSVLLFKVDKAGSPKGITKMHEG